jgi:thiamine biosynthesis protein ThiS
MSGEGGPTIAIRVNGLVRAVPEGASVEAFLKDLGIESFSRLAVEINREILPKDRYRDREIHDGDEIEVVQFVGGG